MGWGVGLVLNMTPSHWRGLSCLAEIDGVTLSNLVLCWEIRDYSEETTECLNVHIVQ